MMDYGFTCRNWWLFWRPLLAGWLLLIAIVPAATAADPSRSPSQLLPSGGIDFYVELRARLFPSVIAAIVDDRNFRLIALEALPFAFLEPEITHTENGLKKTIEIDVKFHPGK
jgi:hypothetical protein